MVWLFKPYVIFSDSRPGGHCAAPGRAGGVAREGGAAHLQALRGAE